MVEREMTCPVCEEAFDVQIEENSVEQMETECPECGENIVFTYDWIAETFAIEGAVEDEDEIEIDEDEDDQ